MDQVESVKAAYKGAARTCFEPGMPAYKPVLTPGVFSCARGLPRSANKPVFTHYGTRAHESLPRPTSIRHSQASVCSWVARRSVSATEFAV